MTVAQRRAGFRALHDEGCFLLPNPWDIGSARRLEKCGFQAVATSSAACAWALGRQDYEITLADSLTHFAMIAQATSLPVNADFENGFSETPEGVAENVTRAIASGIAGLSIEDRHGTGLRDDRLAIACINAARAAIDASGHDVMLVARTEAYLVGREDPAFVRHRLVAFAEAGADVLFAPGIRDPIEIADLVRAVAPLPVNVLRFGPDMDLHAMARAGVRRISTGGALAKAAWTGFDAAALEFHDALPDR